jgi:hypothetical protein
MFYGKSARLSVLVLMPSTGPQLGDQGWGRGFPVVKGRTPAFSALVSSRRISISLFEPARWVGGTRRRVKRGDLIGAEAAKKNTGT